MDTRKINIIQCNLSRSNLAQHEFLQYLTANKYDIGIISEPYVGSTSDLRCPSGYNMFYTKLDPRPVKACIIVSNRLAALGMAQWSTPNLQIIKLECKISGQSWFIASTYLEPRNDPYNTINDIERFLIETSGDFRMLAGDFNGWHMSWGMNSEKNRGRIMNEIFTVNDLEVCNRGNTPTYVTAALGMVRSSCIDITVVSGCAAHIVENWHVDPSACPSSDHSAIEFTLNLSKYKYSNTTSDTTYRYNTTKANWENFKSLLNTRVVDSGLLEINLESADSTALEDIASRMTKIIQGVCDETLPRKGPGARPRPPWWSEQLDDMKRKVARTQTKLLRIKRRGTREEIDRAIRNYKDLKDEYTDMIRRESTKNFREFCSSQNQDNVWSLTNRLLKDTVKRRPATTVGLARACTKDSIHTADELLKHFYPSDTSETSPLQQHKRITMNTPPSSSDDLPFSEEEVIEYIQEMSGRKAPGWDHLTGDICEIFIKEYIKFITEFYNRCLKIGYFPSIWKKAITKVLPKPSKDDYSSLKAYRPIGLLPVFGKLLEKLLIKRINYHAYTTNNMNPNQFGFREQRSTVDALQSAIHFIKESKRQGKLVVAISLDIQAAFDHLWWPAVAFQLKKMNCPANLYNLILSYFEDRTSQLSILNSTATITNTRGCIQGSVCGPSLWNIVLDDLLAKNLPDGCRLQAFADDVLLICSASSINRLTEVMHDSLNTIIEWGSENKLIFSPEKTQALAFSPKARRAPLVINGNTINYSSSIKVLGIYIDDKLNFNEHIKYITSKAQKIFKRICIYIRPTWGVNCENIRTIYLRAIEPMLTYAAGLWGEAVLKQKNARLLNQVQRLIAIRAIHGFRTISHTAALAVAGFPPLTLKIRSLFKLNQIKKTRICEYLPHDVMLEPVVSVSELLHPAVRLTIQFESNFTQDDIEQHATPADINIFTDGSKYTENNTDCVGAAFVAYTNNNTILKTSKFKLHGVCTVFQAELFAINEACQWALKTNYNSTCIYSDSMSALLALKQRSSTNYLVQSIHGSLAKANDNNRIITFQWVKAHADLNGNEVADAAAKSAARSHLSMSYDYLPLSFAKNKLKEEYLKIWNDNYVESTTGQHTKDLCPDLISLTKVVNTFGLSFHMTQFLTGHGYHRKYLQRFHIIDDTNCPCGTNVQTLNHLIQNCPRFEKQRQEHRIISLMANVEPYDVKELISKESTSKSFNKLIKYIIDNLKEYNKQINNT